ncbi:hypothetical protein L2D08_22840 [Domibacillus sp. PGB-M46]|uniref:hypothetical protein n=1 Tax=Domibacillus sp. PGB-M46 TaxID=2910255 RepID=UPI001F582300|nr:hypothetical protein [Domibacillus sp. PGB-M46]MCI2257156.1 hypothetical protein [Domibacillus sp. PGB-M46]
MAGRVNDANSTAVRAGLALAIQHVALSLVFDVPGMAWLFFAFSPLALPLDFIYIRLSRLLPVALAHFVMDLQLVVQLALMTQ